MTVLNILPKRLSPECHFRMQRHNLDDFLACYRPGEPREKREPTERFRPFTHEELMPCCHCQFEESVRPSFDTRIVRCLRASSRATTSSRCAARTSLASQSRQRSHT